MFSSPPTTSFHLYSCTNLLTTALESWDHIYFHPKYSLLNILFASDLRQREMENRGICPGNSSKGNPKAGEPVWTLKVDFFFFFFYFKNFYFILEYNWFPMLLVSSVYNNDSIVCVCVRAHIYSFLFLYHFLTSDIICAQSLSCVLLCDHMDCSPPGSSVHGILQARILEWVAMPSSRGSSQPGDRTQFSCIAGGFFTVWATREALISYAICLSLSDSCRLTFHCHHFTSDHSTMFPLPCSAEPSTRLAASTNQALSEAPDIGLSTLFASVTHSSLPPRDVDREVTHPGRSAPDVHWIFSAVCAAYHQKRIIIKKRDTHLLVGCILSIFSGLKNLIQNTCLYSCNSTLKNSCFLPQWTNDWEF